MRLSSEQFWALCHLGHLLYTRARPDRAADVFEGLTAIFPDRPYPWIGLGLCRDQLGQPKESAHAFQQALELDPGDTRARLALAELLHAHGALQDAVHVAEPFRDSSDDDAVSRRARALLRCWLQQS